MQTADSIYSDFGKYIYTVLVFKLLTGTTEVRNIPSICINREGVHDVSRVV